MRISSVAVRPRMSFARAVSCTPGSCTTMRSAPCCWIDRLGDAELVDAVAQVVMFCLTRAVLDALLRLGLDASRRGAAPPPSPALAHREVGERFVDRARAPCRASRVVAEAHARRVCPRARRRAWRMLLVAQQRADVGRCSASSRFVERGLHVDLQQEVHAAAQVEAEVHRQRADRASASAATPTAG